jgi:hypothetical protein
MDPNVAPEYGADTKMKKRGKVGKLEFDLLLLRQRNCLNFCQRVNSPLSVCITAWP